MQVTLINHSDSSGGASVVTVRLMRALVAMGIDARMLVMNATKPYMRVEELHPAWRRRACFLAEAARIYLGNGLCRDDVFKVSIAEYGMPVHDHPWVKDADVVVLNWVNQGMLSLEEIGRIKAPVVWTMHDMWPFTGVCHHAGVCNRYLAGCGYCPFLFDGTHGRDLSASTHERKTKLYGKKNIRFVAVSNWLAECCRNSSLCRDKDVRVIPNAFPIENFSTVPSLSRAALGLPAQGTLISFGAARIDDPIKGLDLAIEALNRLHDSGTEATAVFFGDIRNPHALDGLRMPYCSLGKVGNDKIPPIMAHCRVILSSSHYETLPGTLIEGMAAGCLPVAFLHGGQADIVTHLRTGYLARYADTDDLAAGLAWAMDSDISRDDLHREVARRFSSRSVAAKYIGLFEEIASR